MKWFMFLILTGCAGIQKLSSEKALGGGVVTGVVAGQVAEKVKDVFTPKYLLLFEPVEICGLEEEDKVTCFIVPCKEEDSKCSATWDKKDWIEENPKVITLRSSLLVPAKHFCKENREACEKYWGYYEGNKIVVKEE